MSPSPPRVLLLVVSGPSGSGKTTLCTRLREAFPTMHYSVSCTTRAPRPGEVDGREYHFISPEAFEARREAGAFLEWARVHDHWYGTLQSEAVDALQAGRDVLMDIDVQGAAQLRRGVAVAAEADLLAGALVDVFILPPSLEVLGQRLRRRAQDSEAVIRRRLDRAAGEMAQCREYRYGIANVELDVAWDALRSIVVAEHHRILPGRIPHE